MSCILFSFIFFIFLNSVLLSREVALSNKNGTYYSTPYATWRCFNGWTFLKKRTIAPEDRLNDLRYRSFGLSNLEPPRVPEDR